MERPIYLDYNGTTPIDPEVVKAMLPFLETEFGNPSSSHWYGLSAKNAVNKAREQVAGILNCTPAEIIFTSGGTESNNHAIRGAAMTMRDKGNHIITSAIEHPAVLEVCRYLEKHGFETSYLPVDEEGLVRTEDVRAAIRPETILITIMQANNEVGTVQPIEEIAAIAHENNIVMHTDAAQSVGKISTDVHHLDADMLSIAGHKVYAPKGIGALYVRQTLEIENFCYGAGQEMGKRAGTENVLEIAGLGKACEIASRDFRKNRDSMVNLRYLLQKGLKENLPDIKINGHPERILPNTLSVSFKNLAANHMLERMNDRIALSAGAACHSEGTRISHVLEAMHIPVEWAKGTLRFSLGRMTTKEEIESAVRIVVDTVHSMTDRYKTVD